MYNPKFESMAGMILQDFTPQTCLNKRKKDQLWLILSIIVDIILTFSDLSCHERHFKICDEYFNLFSKNVFDWILFLLMHYFIFFFFLYFQVSTPFLFFFLLNGTWRKKEKTEDETFDGLFGLLFLYFRIQYDISTSFILRLSSVVHHIFQFTFHFLNIFFLIS